MYEPLTQVDLCGVTMSTNAPTADSAVWIVQDIQGWDSPTVRGATIDPSGRHGTNIAGLLYGGRELTVEGEVIATSQANAWAAHRRACGAMPGLLTTGLLVVHEDIPMWLTVKQDPDTKPTVPSPVNGVFHFSLPLVADIYPLKRALTPHVITIAAGDTETVPNAGTFPAAVVAEAISGGTVKLRDETSGQLMQTRTAVASGTVFDGAAKTVTTSTGVVIFPMGSPSEWISIPTGGGPVTNLGTAPVELTVYDTYP